MTRSRIDRMRERLTRSLQPQMLDIEDESHLHVGHAGARDGRGHFQGSATSENLLRSWRPHADRHTCTGSASSHSRRAMMPRAIFHAAAHHVAGLRQIPTGHSCCASQMCDVGPDPAGKSVMHITVTLVTVSI